MIYTHIIQKHKTYKIFKYANLIKEEKAKETMYDPSRFETN
jgi:hypothetical protein